MQLHGIHQVLLSLGIPRQEHWSGLSFPSPGDLSNPGIEPISPALAGKFFTTEPPGKLHHSLFLLKKKKKKSLTSFRHFHLPERLLNPKQKSKCSHSCTQELSSFTNFSLPPPSSFVEALWRKAYYKLHALLFPLHSKILSLLWFMLSAKSLQSCPTLCDPIDSSPPGSPVPGILQVRTLEWVAISFSNAWKWKVKVKLLSRVWLLATPWIAAYQAPPSMGFSRQEYWSGVPLPSPSLVYSIYLVVLDMCLKFHLPSECQSSVLFFPWCLYFIVFLPNWTHGVLYCP